jgi:hypothetical protein
MKIVLLCCCLCIFTFSPRSIAQKLIAVHEGDNGHFGRKTVYHVLKDGSGIRHGAYKKLSKKKVVEKGWYDNGKKAGTWKYFSVGNLIATGAYREDKKSGVWNFYSSKGYLIQKFDYDHDSMVFLEVDRSKYRPDSFNNFFSMVKYETSPVFIGGKEFMDLLISNNVCYPDWAYEHDLEARVSVVFDVDTFGNTVDVKSVTHPGNGFEEEAVRVVSSFGKAWVPGKLNGHKVKVHYMLPFGFNLSD